MKLDGDSHTFHATTMRIIQEQKSQANDHISGSQQKESSKQMYKTASTIWQELEQMTEEFQNDSQTQEHHITDVERELDTYLNHTNRPDSAEVDVLAWWKEKRNQLPILANLARKYLCIPASSAASERMFSCTGNIITPQRQNLHPRNLEKMVYIKQNFDSISISKWKNIDSDTIEVSDDC